MLYEKLINLKEYMTEDKTEIRATYPRVSDIIGKQTRDDMQGINIDVLVNAAMRGTRVHEYCTSIVKGLWIPDIEEQYVGYVEEFKKWHNEYVEKVLYTNTRLYDDSERFSGEFDMIVKLKGSDQIALIDLKTS